MAHIFSQSESQCKAACNSGPLGYPRISHITYKYTLIFYYRNLKPSSQWSRYSLQGSEDVLEHLEGGNQLLVPGTGVVSNPMERQRNNGMEIGFIVNIYVCVLQGLL